MTATMLTGASPTKIVHWEQVNWAKVKNEVLRLQMRIAKAFREGRKGKVKSLQRLLTTSFYAKLLAVKRVVTNRGGKTPGVDGVVWKTSKSRMRGVFQLKRRGYKALPLRRILIPKSNGKLRPLSIPVMKCRAMQALYLLAFEPVAEMEADANSYGFRPKRSTADAREQCFIALARKTSSRWVLEGDIKSCFDKISHKWLEEHVCLDKQILRKWFSAGYIETGKLFDMNEGTPQGGVISPTLLVKTLSGLEKAVQNSTKKSEKVHYISYADDFIVTGISKEVLENKVMPTIKSFLAERGLELSEEKTKITHIDDGFDFLGQNTRKYNGKLLTKPSKSNVKTFLSKTRRLIKENQSAKTENLIALLNPTILGWSNYHRHISAKRTFNRVDNCIYLALWRWAKRRHPNRSRHWVKQRYFRSCNGRNWIFSAQKAGRNGKKIHCDLREASKTPIKRHTKIKAEATPFDPKYAFYFAKRANLIAGLGKTGL